MKSALFELIFKPVMVPMLGKRKRRERVSSPSDVTESPEDGDSPDLHSLFRQHFEANFKPLEDLRLPQAPQGNPMATPDPSEPNSDWEGLSDTDNDLVEVVEHAIPRSSTPELTKKDVKNFMVKASLSPLLC